MQADGHRNDTITWRHGAELPPDRPRTLRDLFARAVAEHGAHPVFTDERGRSWSWQSLERAADRLAAAWQDICAPGDRVVIVLPNGLAHVVAEWAAWRLAAIAVPIASVWGAQRVAALADFVEPSLVISDQPVGGYTILSSAAIEGLAIVEDGVADGVADGINSCDQAASFVWRPVNPDTVALILYTSGSTGQPRGVMLTHDNICSQQAAFALVWPDVGRADRCASYLPWHHSFGSLAERLWAFVNGVHLTLIPGQGRDQQRLSDTLAQVRPTLFFSVPKIHAVVVADGRGLKACRWVFTAGAALPATIAEAYAERGIQVCEGWGLTESSPSATITDRSAPRAVGVVGQPIPGVSVGVDAQHQIWIAGPGVMHGYWNHPQATAACLVTETVVTQTAKLRRLNSGDLGRWSPLGLILEGRSDHQLKLPNGEKVAVGALETALANHAHIVHAVVGVAPELCALIEAQTACTDAALCALAQATLARSAVPWLHFHHVVRITQPLAMERGDITASHKVARHAVLARFRAWCVSGGPEFRLINSVSHKPQDDS